MLITDLYSATKSENSEALKCGLLCSYPSADMKGRSTMLVLINGSDQSAYVTQLYCWSPSGFNEIHACDTNVQLEPIWVQWDTCDTTVQLEPIWVQWDTCNSPIHTHTEFTYCKLRLFIAWPVTLGICRLNLRRDYLFPLATANTNIPVTMTTTIIYQYITHFDRP